MSYYSYIESTDKGDVVITKSEREIINEYFEIWYNKMLEKFDKDLIDSTYSIYECIDDWVINHRAWQVDDES